MLSYDEDPTTPTGAQMLGFPEDPTTPTGAQMFAYPEDPSTPTGAQLSYPEPQTPTTPVRDSGDEFPPDVKSEYQRKKENGDARDYLSDDTGSDYSQDEGSRNLEFQGTLGTGNFGKVYLARHRTDGQEYAVKVLRHRIKPWSCTARLNTLQEVFAQSALKSRFIVRYHNSWIHKGELYIQCEYCEGGSIRKLRDHNWTWEELKELILQVAFGLHALHMRNVVHLDLKPDNIYFTDKRGKRTYKIGDLGLVRKIADGDDGSADGTNTEEGDGRYLCPAFLQAADNKSYKKLPEADMYSYGKTMIEMARLDTDEPSCCPPHISELLTRCTDPIPDNRPDALSIIMACGVPECPGRSALVSELEYLRRLRDEQRASVDSNKSGSPGLSPVDSSPDLQPPREYGSSPHRPPSLSPTIAIPHSMYFCPMARRSSSPLHA
eukprot:Sspe_Gene.63670::Locus_36748_Transcript_1_1_Confidence_1.000_Length_1541::g.63670::m.63670/K06632/WEE1; wee1-like protein kinase